MLPKDGIIECFVCSDKFAFEDIIYCNNTDVLENRPCSSTHKYEIHPFCHDCVLGLASAAVGEIPLAKGGIGLRCMMTGCDNPILYSGIYKLLPSEIQNKLEERMFEESIGMALLVNLERCKKCNFAIQMEVDKEINKIFNCPACKATFCRTCERDWDDEHIGLSCEEMDKKDKKDKKEREMDGCNKMTCRCGMTQCYICREADIQYDHFCPHYRDPNNPNCNECNRNCLQFEDSNKRDEQLIKEIREREGAEA
uniref:RING-type domain-containing protein n=2 Tax=Meloidogyne incognita group TaxID=654580 RepID=A0A915LMV4_MELJA